jgi:hypothetical protein
MFTRDLNDAVSDGFIPFSYVWGDRSKTRTIIVNGMANEFRENLATLLQYTREILLHTLPLLPYYQGKILFWADAVCINQDDIAERSHQVSLMKMIYGNAQVATCWLGVHSDSHLAAKLLRVISKEWASNVRRDKGEGFLYEAHANYKEWMSKYPEFWTKDCEERTGNKYWNAVQILLQSEYWERVWILQEILLPENPLLFCGFTLVHAIHLVHTSLWIHNMKSGPYDSVQIIDKFVYYRISSGGHLRIHLLIQIHRLDFSKRQGEQNDLSLVCSCQDLQASDSRDKVYGLLGLIKTSVAPDYQRSFEEVYSAFCLAWIKEIRNLDFLSYAGVGWIPQSSGLQLPSWIPNWQAVSEVSRHPGRERPEIDTARYLSSSSSGLSMDSVRFSINSDILYVPGIVCEDIDHVHETRPKGLDALFTDLFEWTESHFFANNIKFANCGLHPFQVLFRTIFRDRHPLRPERLDLNSAETHSICIYLLSVLVRPFLEDTGNSWDHLLQTRLPCLGLDPGPSFAETYSNLVFPNANTIPQIGKWIDAITAMKSEAKSVSAHFLVTYIQQRMRRYALVGTKNGYIGLSVSACQGDVVATVSGCNLPVILRKANSHFQLVGCCFILGLMDGEAMERVKTGEAKEEILQVH